MTDFIMAPAIVGIISLTIYRLFELFARRRERLAMIEKLTEIKNLGHVEGRIDLNFGKSSNFSSWSLRGGCLLVGLGLGLLISFFIISNSTFADFSNYGQRGIRELVFGGSVLFFGGLGLLIAFILEMKYFRNIEK